MRSFSLGSLSLIALASCGGGGGGGGGEPQPEPNEPPSLTAAPELSGGPVQWQLVLPIAGTESLTFTATDPDGDVVVFSISTDAADAFAISPLSGEVRLKDNKILDYEDTSTYYITIRAADAELSSSQTFPIYVEDRNDAPTMGHYHRTVDENAGAGTSVGKTCTGSDQDNGDTLNYAITEGNTNNVFSIDEDTAQISVALNDMLDLSRISAIVSPSHTTNSSAIRSRRLARSL